MHSRPDLRRHRRAGPILDRHARHPPPPPPIPRRHIRRRRDYGNPLFSPARSLLAFRTSFLGFHLSLLAPFASVCIFMQPTHGADRSLPRIESALSAVANI